MVKYNVFIPTFSVWRIEMFYFWFFLGLLVNVAFSASVTEAYVHRSYTHKSVSLESITRDIFQLYLALMTGLQRIIWRFIHERHHANTDTELDPTAPFKFGRWGVWKVFFFVAFYYRRYIREHRSEFLEYQQKHGRNWIDYMQIVVRYGSGGLLILWYFFGVWGALYWLLHEIGYLLVYGYVSSFVHSGKDMNGSIGRSVNKVFIALLTGGGSLHETHHRFPARANFSTKWYELDPGWWLICCLNYLGLAKPRPS